MSKEIINNSQNKKCKECNGKGVVKGTTTIGNPTIYTCDTCQGTGVYKDTHFIIIDNKNKIAIDSDFESK